MRIAILNITGGGISGGYKKYLLNVLPRLAAHPQVEAILCASPASWDQKGWLAQLPNLELVSCLPYTLFNVRPDKELYHALARFSPHIIYIPIERSFCYNNISTVNMIQNMEPMIKRSKGNPFFERVKLFLHYLISKKAIKKADRIIAVSQFVKDYVVKQWPTAPDKVGLVYHGLQFKKYNDATRPASLPVSWGNKFLFTAGSIRPARGLEDSFSALKHLLSVQKESVPGIVIAGECTPNMAGYKKKLLARLKAEGLSANVCWAGILSEDELNWCYGNCLMFIMTSRVESFGLIGLEAMAQGSICLAADNPCLPEIFGSAAVYYQPGNGLDLAQKIQDVLGWDEPKRNEYSVRAKNRALEFSWDKTVAALIKEFGLAMGKLK